MHIHNPCANALLGKRLSRLESALHHYSACYKRYVLSVVLKSNRLAQLKLKSIVINLSRLFAEHTHVHRGRSINNLGQSLLHHSSVGRLEANHFGHGAHNRHILEGHMRTAVDLRGNAGLGANHLDVQIGVRNGYKNLVVAPARSKRRKAVGKRNFSHSRHTRGNANHILLGNTHVKESVGELLFKALGSVTAHKVCVKHNDTVIRPCAFNESLRQSLSYLLIVRNHPSYLPVSFLHISSDIDILWQLAAHSANDAPLPFTVLRIIILALPERFALSIASDIASKS